MMQPLVLIVGFCGLGLFAVAGTEQVSSEWVTPAINVSIGAGILWFLKVQIPKWLDELKASREAMEEECKARGESLERECKAQRDANAVMNAQMMQAFEREQENLRSQHRADLEFMWRRIDLVFRGVRETVATGVADAAAGKSDQPPKVQT